MRIAELLPETALERIDALVAALDRAEQADIAYSDTVSVHFLRNFTIEPIEPYLRFHLMREALRPQLSFGGYDSAIQELLDADSPLHSEDDAPDIIVIALDVSLLDQALGERGGTADAAIERLRQLFDAAQAQSAATVVVNTMLPVLLSADGVTQPTADIAAQIERINGVIAEYARANPGRFAVADWAAMFERAGGASAIDERFWRASMAPFSAPFLDLYARRITRVACALKGRAKKCLVLDCDDTLWGGVIGEDGIEGIRLGPPDGDAWVDLQRSVVELQQRGVVVALCSKNNPEDVWEVLDNHPHAVLDRSHLGAWRINWEDKASNLIALSEELNLLPDSFVFVDDSPRECALIRDALPEVTVLQVPEALHAYPDLLTRDGYFDTLGISNEDRQRSRLYQEQQVRAEGRSRFTGVDDYLASLEQVLRIWPANDADFERVAQLTQKTNQFNLTTRRYAVKKIAGFAADPDCAVYTMSVSDRYGDLGKTGVLIARRQGAHAEIDTLLLSCRVLGRRLEHAFVDRVLARLEKEWGIAEWRATYEVTQKNAQVADFWEQVGFSRLDETDTIKSYRRAAGQRHDNYSNLMTIKEA